MVAALPSCLGCCTPDASWQANALWSDSGMKPVYPGIPPKRVNSHATISWQACDTGGAFVAAEVRIQAAGYLRVVDLLRLPAVDCPAMLGRHAQVTVDA